MSSIQEIDKAGRLVVPKKLRDALHLVGGTRVDIQREGDAIVIRPLHAGGKLIEKKGRLVWSSGGAASFDVLEEIERDRKDRDQVIVGDWIKL